MENLFNMLKRTQDSFKTSCTSELVRSCCVPSLKRARDNLKIITLRCTVVFYLHFTEI